MRILFTLIVLLINANCWAGNEHKIYEVHSPQHGVYELMQFPNGLICASIDVGRGGGIDCNWITMGQPPSHCTSVDKARIKDSLDKENIKLREENKRLKKALGLNAK